MDARERAADPHRYNWRVAIVEDHLLQRRRTESLVTAQTGLKVVWSGETLPDFDTWFDRAPAARRPHLLLLDLRVDRGPSADPARVRELADLGLRVLVVSALTSPELVRKMLNVGISGIVGKRDTEENLVTALWTALEGDQWMTAELTDLFGLDSNRPKLSDQEERVLALYASGLTLDAVADALGVRKDTAKKYLSRVKSKYADLGRPASTKLELNAVALQDGYLDPPTWL